MVLVKKLTFFHLSILGKIFQGNAFLDIVETKNVLLDYRKKSLKSRKIGIFSMVFVNNYLRNTRPGKCVSRYSRKDKRLFRV